MARCARCYAPAAVVLYEGRGPHGYRAILACELDRSSALQWTRGAGGTVTTTLVASAADTADISTPTLF
ncbi:hypothetical protein [Actinomadura harenae]|uniref:Uncharacterized protein n=1 Tax=Actinomadura harenae TaxID=2483351 RepID=A0A3M2LY39_9ACTN|nr:hypothetical protein [Actinomadura harenae]RMI39898.1 hypothetical protein EBO15_28445 [Actinomadura harenae]